MPSPYVRGDRKVRRPFCEDRAYAELMGVNVRLIRRHGGAKKLKGYPEAIRNLILWPAAVKLESKSLTALGMTAQPPVPRNLRPRVAVWNLTAKRRFEVLLRERGLR